MTRKVANWFNDREGELFTVNETPFTREEIVQVINDSVDPIQQVIVEGEKYIGVISYDEHDGWYEYTRWDDAAGEVTIGVCAKCVKEAEYVDEVSRTVDDSTDVARKKFDNHYSDEHSVKPDEIETGATLLSGTTINSNEAIHPGMDGHGSGVDADFVEGNEALQTGSFFSFSEFNAGTVQSQFSSPSASPTGLEVDLDKCIWNADGGNSIYKLNQSGVEQSKFSSPSSSPYGVGINTNNSIWHSDANSLSIYKLNQSGVEQSKFSSPSNDPRGVGVDTSNSVWNSDKNTTCIYKLNESGTVLKSFPSPSNDPRGLSVDDSDSLWYSDRFTTSIHRINSSGSVISKFSTPSDFPQGVGTEENSSIWHTDSNADSIYEIQKNDSIEF